MVRSDVARCQSLVLGAALAIQVAACANSPQPAAAATAPVATASVAPVPSASASAPPAEEQPEQAAKGPGWLGVELAAQPPTEAGVMVRDVVPHSPAQAAGLSAGDILISIDGEVVSRPGDVVRLIAQRRAGARVAVAFRRGDADRLAAVVLEARPDLDEQMRKTYVGAPAPSFRSLTTVQGSVPADVSALKGKVVIVEFWASWCVPCRLSAPKLNAWHERWKAEGLEVLGVTTDPATFATQAALEFGIHYSIASDESGQTSRAYRALSIPTLFVIDRSGVVRDVVVGYSSDRLAQTEQLVQELVRTP